MIFAHAVSPAPRIAEFPTIELEAGFLARNLDKVPSQVAGSWVADVYGDDEGALAAELPLDLIATLYPDAMRGGVVRFDLIRGTPAMSQLQDLADALSSAFTRRNKRLLRKLDSFQSKLYFDAEYYSVTRAITRWAYRVADYDEIIMELYDDVKWLASVVTRADREAIQMSKVDRVWSAFHILAMSLIAAQIGSEELRKEFARIAPQLDNMFRVLKLNHLQGIYATATS